MLVLGNTLVDAASGKTLGQLNAQPSRGQGALANDTLAYSYEEEGKPRVAVVKLEAAKAGAVNATTAPAASEFKAMQNAK